MKPRYVFKLVGIYIFLFFVNLVLKVLSGMKKVCVKGREFCDRMEKRELTEK